jgi:hypothetical protein
MAHNEPSTHPAPSAPQEFQSWLVPRLGAIVLPDQLMGSGVKVRLPQQPGRAPNQIGLLTAIHVILPAILSGQRLGILVPGPRPVVVEPEAIRFAPGSDSALITFPRSTGLEPCLELADWDPRGTFPVAIGDQVIPTGFPGREAVLANPAAGTPASVTIQILNMNVVHIERRLTYASTPEDPLFTETFAGMSGGPVWDHQGHLVGINTVEARHVGGIANLGFTQRSEWDGLFYPFLHPAGIPADLEGAVQVCPFRLGLPHPRTHRLLSRFDCRFTGHVYRSRSSAHLNWGTYGLIERMEIHNNGYRINLEYGYPVPADADLGTMEAGFREAVGHVVENMWLVPVA